MSHECPSIESVIADIEKYDLSVMMVNEDEEGHRFTFSVGLYHSFKHPEVIVFGLKHDVAGRIINELARRIKAGERCDVGKEYDGLLEGYNCVFREAPKGCYPEYFGYAMGFTTAMTFRPCNWFGPIKKTSGLGKLISTIVGFGINRCWSTGLTKILKAIGSSTSREISEFSQQPEFSTRITRFSWSVMMMTETGSFY